MKSLSEDEKAKCVLLMHEFNSPTEVQRKFRSLYNTKEAPTRRSIRKWYKEFQEIGQMRGATTGRMPTEKCPKGIEEIRPKMATTKGNRV